MIWSMAVGMPSRIIVICSKNASSVLRGRSLMVTRAVFPKQLAFSPDSGVCGRDNDSNPLSVSQGIGHATHSQIKAGSVGDREEVHGCFRAHKRLIAPAETDQASSRTGRLMARDRFSPHPAATFQARRSRK